MASELPPVLVFTLPSFFTLFQSRNSHRYRFLKPFSSHLPLPQNADASSVQAVLCSPLQPLTATIIRSLPALRLVVTTSAGTDHIDLPECHRRGIQVVAAASGVQFAGGVAEMAVALLIDVACKISAGDRCIRRLGSSKPWSFSFGSKVGGKRVGIIGLGSIGEEVAKRLEAFDCKIMYHSRNKKPFVSYPFYSNVVDLASNSDVLVLCCPLNEQTRHMINKEVMLALGKDGIIVNVGRGGLIDEKELVKCLVEGEIRGAGLDVFENEPNVPKDLFALDNVVLSPHAAAFTLEWFAETSEQITRSLDDFFSSKLSLITPATCD